MINRGRPRGSKDSQQVILRGNWLRNNLLMHFKSNMSPITEHFRFNMSAVPIPKYIPDPLLPAFKKYLDSGGEPCYDRPQDGEGK